MKYLLIILSLVSVFACHNSKKVANKKSENTRFIVSFISIGGGIDAKALETFDADLVEFQKSTQKELKFEKKRWGREGEVDYCFTLSELSKGEQKTFIEQTKEKLKTFERVRYSENTPCRQ